MVAAARAGRRHILFQAVDCEREEAFEKKSIFGSQTNKKGVKG
jgi:hypothetical protein